MATARNHNDMASTTRSLVQHRRASPSQTSTLLRRRDMEIFSIASSPCRLHLAAMYTCNHSLRTTSSHSRTQPCASNGSTADLRMTLQLPPKRRHAQTTLASVARM